MIRYVPYSRVVSLPKKIGFLNVKRRYVQFLAVKLKEPAAIAAMLTGQVVQLKSIRDPRIESYEEVARRHYLHGRVKGRILATTWAWQDAEDRCKDLNRKFEQEKS